MTKQRRSFTPEFKREAADLVLKQNYSYIEASRSLGSKRPPNTPCVIKRAPTCAATARLSHSHAALAGV